MNCGLQASVRGSTTHKATSAVERLHGRLLPLLASLRRLRVAAAVFFSDRPSHQRKPMAGAAAAADPFAGVCIQVSKSLLSLALLLFRSLISCPARPYHLDLMNYFGQIICCLDKLVI